MNNKDHIDAAKTCLLAGALGDALGAAIEFSDWEEIRLAYGDAGLTGFAPAYGRLGAITDDTQMTLFTAEAMVLARYRSATKGICSLPDMAWRSYQSWLDTQGWPSANPEDTAESTLARIPALRHRRAPGNTCLDSLRGKFPPDCIARNNSKGCGGVMRVAPCGLIWLPSAEAGARAFDMGVTCAQLTHGHPTGYLTAGVLAQMVYELARGASLPVAIDAAQISLCGRPGHEETLRAIRGAVQLAESDLQPGPLAIRTLGEGWVAEEALAIGIYCALVSPSVTTGLLLAVNHDGDSDSTGSIAGNLLGAMNGMQAVAEEWLSLLECRDLIERVAHDLAICMTARVDPDGDESSAFRTEFWRRWGRAV